MRKRREKLPKAMPYEEYAKHLRETEGECRALLETVTKESAPRYRIIPQREYRMVLGDNGKETAECTGMAVYVLDGTNLEVQAIVRTQRDWELLRGGLSGEEESNGAWWISC